MKAATSSVRYSAHGNYQRTKMRGTLEARGGSKGVEKVWRRVGGSGSAVAVAVAGGDKRGRKREREQTDNGERQRRGGREPRSVRETPSEL